jgi:hypothetical protein
MGFAVADCNSRERRTKAMKIFQYLKKQWGTSSVEPDIFQLTGEG